MSIFFKFFKKDTPPAETSIQLKPLSRLDRFIYRQFYKRWTPIFKERPWMAREFIAHFQAWVDLAEKEHQRKLAEMVSSVVHMKSAKGKSRAIYLAVDNERNQKDENSPG